jgi:cytidine deaminase
MAPKDEAQSALISAARSARSSAYAPYSNYAVGAALRTKSGAVYTGVNIENAVNSLGTCAERVAVFKAVADGKNEFESIAVVTENGGSPCGSCRQVLAEFGLDTAVVVADSTGKIHLQTTIGKLLPDSFGPHDLE